MAYISYTNLWESEFNNTVSEDKVQDMNVNQIKLEVHDSYKKDQKLTTNFEAIKDEDLLNKAYVDKNLLNIDRHVSFIAKY